MCRGRAGSVSSIISRENWGPHPVTSSRPWAWLAGWLAFVPCSSLLTDPHREKEEGEKQSTRHDQFSKLRVRCTWQCFLCHFELEAHGGNGDHRLGLLHSLFREASRNSDPYGTSLGDVRSPAEADLLGLNLKIMIELSTGSSDYVFCTAAIPSSTRSLKSRRTRS